MSYLYWLVGTSLVFLFLERMWPWRKQQRTVRDGLVRDLGFLAMNGHVFSLLTAGFLGGVSVYATSMLQNMGLQLGESPIRTWPVIAQFAAFLVLSDFLQWCVHNLLHRIPWLWAFHKVHHSITTMDWIGNWHFHWMEILVYRSLLWLPLAWLDASPLAVFAVAVVSTIWGDLNHANLDIDLGRLGYVLNSPRMHLWHHDQSVEGGTAKNFGVIFSLWDFAFGTAYWPRDREPAQLGYQGIGEMPTDLGRQLVWPLSRARRTTS